MRKDSSIEAHQVADELMRLEIEPHVLELDWQSYGDPAKLTNVETAARTLRYQAMGRACRDRDINTLLFAHHADDQHETVLSRIYSNYVGIGLRGMDLMASIPECAGIYGVDYSGHLEVEQKRHEAMVDRDRRMLVESGGVNIGRPLLPFRKAELVQTCKENHVKWFEDHTNADPTLTIRNTFRSLIKGRQLPFALSIQRLSEMSARISDEHDDIEAAALRLFNEMHTTLDLRSGVATFNLSRALGIRSATDFKLYAILLRKMLEVVSCKNTISLQAIAPTAECIFPSEAETRNPETLQIAGVEISEICAEKIERVNQRTFRFCRALPAKHEQLDLQIWPSPQTPLVDIWSAWALWDGRYWIRIRAPENGRDLDLQVIVKFLSAQDLGLLRTTLSTRQRQKLNDFLHIAKGSTRFTLPAIVTRQRDNGSEAEVADRIVALPTLDWSVDGWKQYNGNQESHMWLWKSGTGMWV